MFKRKKNGANTSYVVNKTVRGQWISGNRKRDPRLETEHRVWESRGINYNGRQLNRAFRCLYKRRVSVRWFDKILLVQLLFCFFVYRAKLFACLRLYLYVEILVSARRMASATHWREDESLGAVSVTRAYQIMTEPIEVTPGGCSFGFRWASWRRYDSPRCYRNKIGFDAGKWCVLSLRRCKRKIVINNSRLAACSFRAEFSFCWEAVASVGSKVTKKMYWIILRLLRK